MQKSSVHPVMKNFLSLLLVFCSAASGFAQLPVRYFPENYLQDFLDTASFHSCSKEGESLFGGAVLTDSMKEIIRKAPQTIRYHYQARKIDCYESKSRINWCGKGCEQCLGDVSEIKIHYRSSSQRRRQYYRLLRHIQNHQRVAGKQNMYRSDERGTNLFFSENTFCNVMEVMLSHDDNTLMLVRYH